MAGHSHWANIQYRKAAVDAKRGKLHSKIARLIISAAKQGGGSPDSNLKLRYALEKAREASMPKDTVERAIKKGTGQLEGMNFEEIVYEGYGPDGVAVMVDALTDNRHRTAPEMKKMFETHGGNLGASGAVGWMFDKKGVLVLEEKTMAEDKLMELALEAGAEDVQRAGNQFHVLTAATGLPAVKSYFETKKVPFVSAQVTQIPKSTLTISNVESAKKLISLMEELDNHDDVQQTYANFEVPEEILKAISQ